jgi:iron complex outermembrane receptor protein
MKYLFLLFFNCVYLSTIAQSLNGVIKNSENNHPIEGALIKLPELGISVVTNKLGEFEITNKLPASLLILIEYKGFDPYTKQLNLPLTAPFQVNLTPCHIEIDEIHIVSSGGVLQKESVTYIENKKIADLNTIQSSNLGEAISKIPGIAISSTGNGISKPVIRGLSGTRIITLLNGIRVENQQWGSDHGMGITALGIGSVEVIKGPASLFYGSDALGGILYFVDEPYTSNGNTNVQLSSSFETNSNLSQTTLGLKIAKNKLRFNVFAGTNSAADFKLPNSNYLVNSRYKDQLAKISIGYSKGKWVSNLRYNYLNSFVGIPGETTDSLVTPTSFQSSESFRKIQMPYQHITNHIISLENKWILKKGREIATVIGNTTNSLNEHEDNIQIANLSMHLNSFVYSFKYKHTFTEFMKITAGFQGMLQQNRNAETAEERLIPNAKTMDNGMYAVFDGKFGKYSLQAGVRTDIRTISTLAEDIIFSKKFNSFTYSTGVLRTYDDAKLRLNFSTGFRAPHTSELLANGAHEGALRYEIGSTSLKTEQASQVDVSFEIANEHLSLVINPFFNALSNYIYLAPTDSVIENRPVYVYAQTNKVALYGGEISAHIHPHQFHGLHLETSYSYVRGELHSGTSLPFIPQSRLISLLKFPIINKQKWKGTCAIQHDYYFKQTYISTFETPTNAYNLVNASVRLTYGKDENITFSGGVKNMFNVAYFNHLSSLKNIGIQQPGRNYYISLLIALNYRNKGSNN